MHRVKEEKSCYLAIREEREKTMFVRLHHRKDKQQDNYDYSSADYEAHKRDIEKYGFTFIPHHESVTGNIVSYYGKV